MNTAKSVHEMHLSIAEAGKVYAIKGDHQEALSNYREALRLAVSIKAPDVFFRHYTQCVLESLELTNTYDEIVQYCTNADDYYIKLNLTSSLHRRDHGSVLERLGIVQLKSGETSAGHESLKRASNIAGKGVLPLTEEILAWLDRKFTVDTSRLLRSQRQHNYFVVRKNQIDKKWAAKNINVIDTNTAPQIS